MPTLVEARAWADAANADNDTRNQLLDGVETALAETTSWAEAVGKGVAEKQRQIGREERAASVVRNFTTMIIPGLLLTAEYTRRQTALAADLLPVLARDRPATLAAWGERQQVLYEPGRRFEFVVTEAALRWRPGPDDNPRMLAAQMHYIASLSTLDTVRFGIIPWSTATRFCPMHGFIVFGEPGVDEHSEIYIYTTTREFRVRDPAEVAVYLELWGRLCEGAVFGEDARDLLRSLAAELLVERTSF